MVTMTTILSSRFVGGIRPEVEKVERQLTLFAETLDEWVQVGAGSGSGSWNSPGASYARPCCNEVVWGQGVGGPNL